MGALIAGVSMSTFPYNVDVIAKVINIRDFFVTLFFVALGMKIPRTISGDGDDRPRHVGLRPRQPSAGGFSGALHVGKRLASKLDTFH